jgi:hypothetical protein
MARESTKAIPIMQRILQIFSAGLSDPRRKSPNKRQAESNIEIVVIRESAIPEKEDASAAQ